ncbi:uncharacterized protein [Amphiura filiformis]|uniref:uncharacterized protein n=1 Tax=Amphiura filiformis TaxID=82378 RepID=UPI003B20B6F8
METAERIVKGILFQRKGAATAKARSPENNVLAKGLNYAVSPTNVCSDEFVIATELVCKKLTHPEAIQLRAKVASALKSSKPPKSNLSKDERQAVKDLKKEDSIIILPADKGRATVILDKDEYNEKVNNLLGDTKTYEELPSDPTQKYKRKLLAILSRLNEEDKITFGKYKQLYPTAENIPRLYCTPKIHKPNAPLRPIVDYTSTIGYATSRWLADILAPMVGNTVHHVKNSSHLADELVDILIDEGDILNSHDVVALFTCTPISKVLEIVKERVNKERWLKDYNQSQGFNLTAEDVVEVLDFILSTTSPLAANIYMEYLEQAAIMTAPIECKPKFWKRYVDDILEVVAKDAVKPLTDHLNQVDDTQSIKFTFEEEVDGKIPFLDTLIVRRENGSVKLLVYRKATHTNQYLNFKSHHPFTKNLV